MRTVVAHIPGVEIRPLRQMLHGAGAECAAEDCVPWDRLDVRLARGDAQLVVVKLDGQTQPDWQTLRQSLALTKARKIVIGPPTDLVAQDWCRQDEIAEFLDETKLRVQLDACLARLDGDAGPRQERGTLMSVLAPTAGSGGSTVAVNLAGSLARQHPQEVALVEVARQPGDVALLLNAEVEHSLGDVCQRWQTLDRASLRSCGGEHPSELSLILNRPDDPANEFLSVDAIRRIGMLARMTFGYTVFALRNQLTDVDLETLQFSDKIVLVVRPDVPAVRRAARTVDELVALGIDRERFRLVVNRWGQGGQLKLDQIESSLDLKTHLLIPDDPARVNAASNRGVLLHEFSGLATINRRFAKLAESLNGRGKRHGTRWSWLT